MATGGGDDSEWQKLPCEEKVQHKVLEEKSSHFTLSLFVLPGMESPDDRL